MKGSQFIDMDLKEQLSKIVDLRIPGFLNSVPEGMVRHRSFREMSTSEWYYSFLERVFNSLNRSFMPVFRASDGEFYFATGYRPPRPPQGKNTLLHYCKSYLGALRVGRIPGRFRSGSPKYGWEEFHFFEWWHLREKFADYLHCIASEGIIAINFSITEPPFSEQYFQPFCDWLDKEEISINSNNYIPFYFVYALLNGPDANNLLKGRNVLVVTSYDEEKKEKITEGLKTRGAYDIQFLKVSRSKALKDRISINDLTMPIDVALVAAGTGAASILCQLEPLNTLCIDAGFCLEILADPSKAKSRVFCEPDSRSPSGIKSL